MNEKSSYRLEKPSINVWLMSYSAHPYSVKANQTGSNHRGVQQGRKITGYAGLTSSGKAETREFNEDYP